MATASHRAWQGCTIARRDVVKWLAGLGAIYMTIALARIAIGIGIAVRRTSRLALWAAFGISLFYLIAATVTLPLLWTDPLGPLMKVAPILVLNLVALAILEDR